MRHTRAHRDNRRSHHALENVALVTCPNCKAKMQPHKVCENCGQYKGRQVVDVHSAINKKEAKRKKAEAEKAAEAK
jgi:large subunit ribosomal protein L32